MKRLIEESTLKEIADAIRTKEGSKELIECEDMKQRISDLSFKVTIIPSSRNYQNPFNVLTEIEFGNIYVPANGSVSIRAIHDNTTKYIDTALLIPTLVTDTSINFWTFGIYGVKPKLYQYSWSSDHLTESILGVATDSDVLTKSNSLQYTPYSDYQPSTKKYVDDKDVYNYQQYLSINHQDMWKKSSPLYIFQKGIVIQNSSYNAIFKTDSEITLFLTHRDTGNSLRGFLIANGFTDSTNNRSYIPGIYKFVFENNSVSVSEAFIDAEQLGTSIRGGIRVFNTKLDATVDSYSFNRYGVRNANIAIFEKGLALKTNSSREQYEIDTDDPLFVIFTKSFVEVGNSGINTTTECQGYVYGDWTNDVTGEMYSGINYIDFTDSSSGTQKITITKLTQKSMFDRLKEYVDEQIEKALGGE